ncbi:MAG TPA: hypothetical protein ENG75_06675 [Nitrospirae bacterium]|nr:hypothetical protein [Gammaproteobacteria bacterium]HDK17608.1 hypothetical protein [Nitrospirota bacterium]HDZ62707.1 hypothetical protein [Nitrospirota bacterium]
MNEDYKDNIELNGDEAARKDSPAYEFIGLIKTKRGDYFQHEYEDIESFRKELKEHIDDVEWANLLRCDTGTVVDVFHPGERQKIGIVDTEPKRSAVVPEGLNAHQATLREAAINRFKAIKYKSYISEQLININARMQLSSEIRNLFDEHGTPPANAPLEDIIAEREKTENAISWLEAICLEMSNNLTRIKEIEDFAMKLMAENLDKK